MDAYNVGYASVNLFHNAAVIFDTLETPRLFVGFEGREQLLQNSMLRDPGMWHVYDAQQVGSAPYKKFLDQIKLKHDVFFANLYFEGALGHTEPKQRVRFRKLFEAKVSRARVRKSLIAFLLTHKPDEELDFSLAQGKYLPVIAEVVHAKWRPQ